MIIIIIIKSSSNKNNSKFNIEETYKMNNTATKLTRYIALSNGLLKVRYASMTKADCSAANIFSF